MVKGKPWENEDEQKLISWYKSGTTNLRVLAFSFEGKYTENAIYQKLLDLGLLKEEDIVWWLGVDECLGCFFFCGFLRLY